MEKKIISIPKILTVCLITMILSFVLLFQKLPPQVPLFYSLSEGEDIIADSFLLFLLPCISIIIVFVNTILKKRYFSDNIFLEHIFYYCNLFIVISTTVIFLRVLFLVT